MSWCTTLNDKDIRLLGKHARHLAKSNLEGCPGVSGDGILALSALTELTSLNIARCGKANPIGHGSLAGLQHLPCLSELNLARGYYRPSAWLLLGCLTYLIGWIRRGGPV